MTPSYGGVPTLRTNLADYAVTKALKDGRVRSELAQLDFCGPTPAHNGFKAMVRESAFDCGELAIVTFLQAKAYGKPFVMLPAPLISKLSKAPRQLKASWENSSVKSVGAGSTKSPPVRLSSISVERKEKPNVSNVN